MNSLIGFFYNFAPISVHCSLYLQMNSGTRLVTEKLITEYINKLANQQTQKSMSKELLENGELWNYDIDPCFFFEKHHLLQILTILKITPSMDTLRAIVIVITNIVKAESSLKIARIEALHSSGIIEQIIEISIPILVSKKAKGFQMARLCLEFFRCTLDSTVVAQSFVGEGKAPIFITMHEVLNLLKEHSLVFVSLCLDCLCVISKQHRLNLYMTTEHIVYTTLLTTTYETDNAEGKDLLIEIRISSLQIIRNICKSSPHVIEYILHEGFIRTMLNLLQNSATTEETLCAIRLVCTFLKGGKPYKKLERLLEKVYVLTQQPQTPTNLKVAGLKCIKNATIIFSPQFIISVFVDPYWLLEECKNSSEDEVCKASMVILHNLTSLDPSIGSKKSFASLTLYVTEIALNKPENHDILYSALCIMCNLAFVDKMSQTICEKGQRKLVEQLFKYSTHENENIRVVSLENIRNLCIDKQSCGDILEIGFTSLCQNLFEGKQVTHTMQIIRNIWVQQEQCFYQFYNEPGFIDSLAYVLRSGEADAQRASLDLVEYLLNTHHVKYIETLITHNILQSLQFALTSPHKKKALALYVKLKKYRFKEDPWLEIQKGWKKVESKRSDTKKKKKLIY
jgi:hypothetical protein